MKSFNTCENKILYHLECALKHTPDHVSSFIAICGLHLKNKNLLQLEKLFQNASDVCKKDAGFLFIETKFHILSKEYEKALVSLENAIQMDPHNPEFYKMALQLDTLSGRPTNRKYLETLIDLCPTDGVIHMELGKILNHPDDFEQAKLLFEVSIDLLPRQTLPILLLVKHLIKGAKSQEDGTIYYAPDFETSKKLLQKAHQINPNELETIYLLGEIFYLQKEYKPSKENFKLCIKKNFKLGSSHYRLAKIYFAEDDIEETIFHLNASTEFNDHKIDSMIELSDLYVSKSNFTLAKKHCENSLMLTRESIEDLSQYASTLVDQARFFEARELYQKIEKRKKDLSKLYFLLYVSLNKGENSCKNAIKLEESIAIDPSNSQANFALSKICLAQGDKNKARLLMKTALINQWDNPDYHAEYGKLEISLGNMEKGSSHLAIAKSFLK